jgi:hypothetical protein
MLRIKPKVVYANGFPCYESHLVNQGNIYDLRKKWFQIQMKSPEFHINHLVAPKVLQNNFYHYLSLETKSYYRCSHFTKYLINSNFYNLSEPKLWNKVIWMNHLNIIHVAIFIGVHYGIPLYWSKLGGGGIYINDAEQLKEIYGDTKEIHLSPVKLISYEDPYFERNLNVDSKLHLE